MALISANIQYNRGEHLLLDYSSLQPNYSTALAWAQNPYSNAAVGQFIYIQETEVIDEITYLKGPYVVDVIGENATLTPLSKGTAGNAEITDVVSGLNEKVNSLDGELSSLDTKVDNLSASINIELEGIKDSLNNIEVPVTDVQVDGISVLTDGVAKIELTDYAKTADIESTYATKDSVSNTYAEKNSVYEKTEVDNKISTSISDFKDTLKYTDESVPGQYISSVSMTDGVISVTREDLPTIPTYEITKASDSGDYSAVYNLMCNGNQMGVSINIPKDMVISSGSVVTLVDGEVSGYPAGTYIKLELANSQRDALYISVKGLIDVYTSGDNYVKVDGYTISINYDALVESVKNSLSEVYETKGTASSLLANATTDILNQAKTYTDGFVESIGATITAIDGKFDNYYTKEVVDNKISVVSNKVDTHDNRLVIIENLLVGNEGSGATSTTTIIDDVATLKATVGTKATTDSSATGLCKDVDDVTARVSTLESNSLSKIIINNVEYAPEAGVVTIPLVTSLDEVTEDEKKIAVSAEAVEGAIINITTELNNKLNVVVGDAPETGVDKTLYITTVDGIKTEKIYIDGAYHTLGSDLYATKDLASTSTSGLMSTDDKIKLDSISAISTDELDSILK